MTSKEALKDIKDVLNMLIDFVRLNINEDIKKQKFEIIKKDLDLFEDYRKTEKEIGVDLIKAVELCKQVNRNKVVYIKKDGSIDTINLLDELDIELFNHRLYVNTRIMCVSLDLYNYGKTWALDKEEFYENIK